MPWIQDLKLEFWNEGVQELLTKLAECELPESYDQGVIGTRKTLAVAGSAVLEPLAKAWLTGYHVEEVEKPAESFDTENSNDLQRAWNQIVRETIYESLVDNLFQWFINSEAIEEMSPKITRAIDDVIIQ